MESPLISIIVPVYNVEKYIVECIESILKQSYKNIELIMVDDGSTDNCGSILDEYSKNDARVKVIHQANSGIVGARNAGTEISCGEYIMNVDGDDFIAPHVLQMLADSIEKTHADVYCFGFYRLFKDEIREELPFVQEGIYDTPEKLSRIFNKMVYDKEQPFYSFGLCPSLWSRISKRELYMKAQKNVDKSVAIGEDFMTTLPLMLSAKKVCIINKPVYYYRIVPGSASRRFNVNEVRYVETIMHRFALLEDIDKFGLKHQLGAYCVDTLFNFFYAYAKRCKSYTDYKEFIKKLDNIVYKFIGNCQYRFCSVKVVIIMIIMKHHMWKLLWMIAKKGRTNEG